MKTFIQKVILLAYGWRIQRVPFKVQNYYSGNMETSSYTMLYRKNTKLYPVDVVWMKKFGYNTSKRVILAIILGDLFLWCLGAWFIVWLLIALNRGY